MGLFSTRNSDGASGKSESVNTVPKAEMDRIKAVGKRHNPGKAAVFTDEAVKFRKAHDPKKAGTN